MSQTVARALSIIEFFAEKPRSLTAVSQHLEVHKSTALRLLQTLEAGGFARQNADGAYTVGFRMVALAQQALDDIDVHAVAHPHLLALSRRIGHTLHLAQLMDDEIVYIDKVEGEGAVKMRSRVGSPAELHTAGIAKVVLAYLEEPVQSRLLQRVTYRRFTDTTLTSAASLRHELEKTVVRGWAEDDGEFEDYINCIALPIRNARGVVRAGLSMTAVRALAPLEELRAYVPQLKEAATAISRELGWVGTEASTGAAPA
jgi:DNA-binding IclR family transcriptional regulator